MKLSVREKVKLINKEDQAISISRQCKLLGISRRIAYYEPQPLSQSDKIIMDAIDRIYTKFPAYGKRRMTAQLNDEGYVVGKKKVRSLMVIMGLEAIYPKPRTSIPCNQHKKYPYLLKNKFINNINEVWGSDITYIRLESGFVYLVAIMDWFSRFVLSWELSNTLDSDFCILALNKALEKDKPLIFNSDQGVQFTSHDFTRVLESNKIKISMAGKGRCYDNIFVERLWRTVKYEEVYIKDYRSVLDAYKNLKEYFELYNYERLHESLGYQTPAKIFKRKK